ncbi:acyl protein synthase/acyl-CoA reductase RfbN [Lachnospiraceae bacterium KM106-2]|nr:acyl protein synthase/acyl-CoA reductase RfbN [Lachnospiraceae bacterium KM106-2]
MEYKEILSIAPYSLEKKEKSALLTEQLKELTQYHYGNCKEYRNICDLLEYREDGISSYEEIPFVPVRIFKELELKSMPEEENFKTMTSSGTTGQKKSKIFLDRETSSNQQKTLVKIVSDFTGKARLPMIIMDCPSVIKNRAMFSARGAGILGFSIFASDRMYAFDDDMKINLEGIEAFLEKHQGKPILIFGFTFMIWQHFYKVLKESKKYVDLSNAVMIHGGGWKKLQAEAVEPLEFNRCLEEVCGIKKVYDYYGMVEQTGCIYMECECGHLHASIFSDVLMRRNDFSLCEIGEKGMIQVVSMLPKSYPGHSILTEDEGVILGEDDCPCGRKGKYFKILGRIKNAEVRGCSDTYEQR